MKDYLGSENDNVWHEGPDDDSHVDNVALILNALRTDEGVSSIIEKCKNGGIPPEDASEVLEYICYQDGVSLELIKALQYAKVNVQFIDGTKI